MILKVLFFGLFFGGYSDSDVCFAREKSFKGFRKKGNDCR